MYCDIDPQGVPAVPDPLQPEDRLFSYKELRVHCGLKEGAECLQECLQGVCIQHLFIGGAKRARETGTNKLHICVFAKCSPPFQIQVVA